MKIVEFTNSVDLGEMAHDEPSHLDQHCLGTLYSLNSQYDKAWNKKFYGILSSAYFGTLRVTNNYLTGT